MTINELFNRNTSEDDALAKLIDKIANKLGFDPLTYNPQICWFWPGPFQRPNRTLRQRPILRTSTGTSNPLRILMEFMEGQPFPKHPHKKRPAHYVRPCQLHHHCVNPAHARVLQLTDLYELNIPYEQRHKFYFPEEMWELLEQFDGDMEAIRSFAPLNFIEEDG
jgi:hypothetical protein